MPEAAAVCGDAGGVAAGLSVEGRAMLGALLCDGLRADDLELTLLLDGAVTLPLPPGVDHDRVTVIRKGTVAREFSTGHIEKADLLAAA